MFAIGAIFSKANPVGLTIVGNWVKFDIGSGAGVTSYSKRLIMIPLKSIVSIKVLERSELSPESSGKESKVVSTATLVVTVSDPNTRRDLSDSDILVENLPVDQARESAEKLLTSIAQAAEEPSRAR